MCVSLRVIDKAVSQTNSLFFFPLFENVELWQPPIRTYCRGCFQICKIQDRILSPHRDNELGNLFYFIIFVFSLFLKVKAMTRRGRETGHFAVSGEKKNQKISLWFFPLVLFSLGNFFVSLWENFDLEKICKLRIEE